MPRRARKWTLEEIKEIRSSSDGIAKLRKRFRTNIRTIKLIRDAASEEDALAIPETMEPGKPSLGSKGDEHIKEHFHGYSKDDESFLFVMHPDGRVQDLRLEYPLLYPIFQMMQTKRGYGGDFPQFISDAVETLFANAGYELALVPKTQSMIYQQVVELLKEGKLELVYEGDKVSLEVTSGNKDGRGTSPNLPEGERPAGGESTQEGKEEPVKSQ